MNTNFTDSTPLESDENNEVLMAINFSLSNQNQYAQTSDDLEYSEISEASTVLYDFPPFPGAETILGTNPVLPGMTNPSRIPNFCNNNIENQNDQPTYLPGEYDSPHEMENLAENSSRNSISTGQNSGFSNSINLSPSSLGQSGQGSLASNTENASVPNHYSRTAQWIQYLPNISSPSASSSRSNFLPRENNSGTVFSSWASSYRSDFNTAIYSPSSSPNIPVTPIELNPRVISETNPSDEISDENCVVITTVERRYIYGRRKISDSDEPNITDAYAAGPSHAGPINCRSNGNTINRDNTLQQRSYQTSRFHGCNGSLPCNCNPEYRSHPYMSIVPNSQYILEETSGRLSVQNGSRRRSVSGINADLPPFETINLTPTPREIHERSIWANSPTGLLTNSSPHNTMDEASNREIALEEDPFDVIQEEPLSIEHLRPSISFADFEDFPNQIESLNAPVNHPRNEQFEININDVFNPHAISNATFNTLWNNQNPSNLRRAILQNQYMESMNQYEMHRRHYGHTNRMRNRLLPRPLYYNEVRTASIQSQTESLTNSQSPPSYSQAYKRKKNMLRAMLKPPTGVPKIFEIKVKRNRIFEDSYRIIANVDNVEKLKSRLWVVFEGEVGVDYGGIQREWFYLLSKEIFNPNYGFFEYCTTNDYSLHINPNSEICSEQHLNYFMFIGRIVGMAVYHEKLLDVSISQIFYKMWKRTPLTLEDLKKVDPQYYQTLSWVKKNDASQLDLDFTVNENIFGHISVKDLIPNGSQIPVTNDNKDQYIELFVKWKFESRMNAQMQAFLTGFHDLIPKNALNHFNESELDPLICGIKRINYRDWRSHTIYSGGYNGGHPTIRLFWSFVKSLSQEMRAKLLQFVTGTSRLPMNGFKELIGSSGPLMFTIHNIGSCDSLPRAHTCFNRLDLPAYKSEQQLREKLLYALEGCEGYNGVD